MQIQNKNIFRQLSVIGLVVFTIPLIGCEFGNKSRTVLTGYDTISGYYTSLPQTVSFRAKIGTEAQRTKAGTIGDMPAFLKKVMANPTLLYFDDPIGGIGSLRSRLDTMTGIPTYIQDKLGSFAASSAAASELSGCRLSQETINSGTFSQLASTLVISDVKVRGTISLDYTLTYTITGDDIDCDPMRARLRTCYIDGTDCSSDRDSIFYRPFVLETFDPYVNVGLITAAEIGSFRTLGYSGTYR